MIKLVAFDWNGTILADTNAIVAGDNAVLKYFGRKNTTLKEVQDKFTIPVKNFYIAMGLNPKILDKNPDKMWSIFQNAYEPLENKCRSRAGAKLILQFLKNNGIKAVIFSNHMIQHIQKQLKRLNIYNYIDTILARELNDSSHFHIKSKDKKISELVHKLTIKPKEVLIVGDTDEEIDIAKFFGYYSIALTGGNTSTPRLRAMKPDFLIHNLKDLKQIIIKLNS